MVILFGSVCQGFSQLQNTEYVSVVSISCDMFSTLALVFADISIMSVSARIYIYIYVYISL